MQTAFHTTKICANRLNVAQRQKRQVTSRGGGWTTITVGHTSY